MVWFGQGPCWRKTSGESKQPNNEKAKSQKSKTITKIPGNLFEGLFEVEGLKNSIPI